LIVRAKTAVTGLTGFRPLVQIAAYFVTETAVTFRNSFDQVLVPFCLPEGIDQVILQRVAVQNAEFSA